MSVISKLTNFGAAGAGGADSYWIALLGGSSYDTGWAVTLDSSGNIIVAGVTQSDGAGSGDLLTAKYDSLGSLQWARTLGGSAYDQATGVVVDSSDNIYICGVTQSDGAGSNDAIIAKYNSSGTLQWDYTLGGSSVDRFNAIAIDSSNDIVAFGSVASDGAGSNDLLIAKYNSSGTLQWDRTLGGSSADYGDGVAIDSSDNIIVAGNTQSDGAGSADGLIAKYNSSGTLQWSRTLGDTGLDRFNGVNVDSSDNIIAAGYHQPDGTTTRKGLVAKYNSSGTLQWHRILDGATNEEFYFVTADSSGNIIAVGRTDSDGEGSNDCLIAKYNSSGVLQWDKTLGGTGSDVFNGVTVDASDNIIVAGRTESDGAGSGEILTAKLPPDGTGDGTYGSLVYQDAVLTDSAGSLTDSAAVLTDAAAVLTSAAAVLTDSAAVLTEELIEVTP